jgi:hypothetical protein
MHAIIRKTTGEHGARFQEIFLTIIVSRTSDPAK